MSRDRTATSRYSEEWLDDPYAALDVQAPHIMRTFEDAVVPEDWGGLDSVMIPAAPQVPQPPAQTHFEAVDSIGELSDRLPTVDPPPEHNSARALSDRSPEYVSFANLGSSPAPAADELPIDEQLGVSILETCREVHTAVSRWQTLDGDFNTIDPSHALLADDEDVVLPAPPSEYDVIEPRGVQNNARESDLHLDAKAEHYVPRPKYRHVFSTLRRRLGLVRRDV